MKVSPEVYATVLRVAVSGQRKLSYALDTKTGSDEWEHVSHMLNTLAKSVNLSDSVEPSGSWARYAADILLCITPEGNDNEAATNATTDT